MLESQQPCVVTPVTFRPYPETGEFACFGVVLRCRPAGYFGFRLGDRNRAVARRVHSFFREIPANVFRLAAEAAKADIARVAESFRAPGLGVDAEAMLRNLVRPRESLVRFGAPMAVMSDDPAAELDRQYRSIVERGFATEPYAAELERRVRGYLRESGVRYGTRMVHAARGYDFQMPFVFGPEGAERAIKPISLEGMTPTAVTDETNKWLFRLDEACKLGFAGDRLLVPIRMPAAGSPAADAAEWAAESFAKLTRTLVADGTAAERGAILAFAS